jgi:epoxyqueuosine reductase
MSLESELKKQAHALGFSLVGIARADDADAFAHLQKWLASGYAGTMAYMERHAEARRSPTSILPEVRGVVMVAMEYGSGSGYRVPGFEAEQFSPEPGTRNPIPAQIARYARGPEYHTIVRTKLKELLAWVHGRRPESRGRAVVDTAPLLERDFARRAGLGWIGKNTMLINKHRGSYFFLGALLLDFELTPDEPHTGFHCGTCTACLDACPTDAFPAPGVLDARRCISYLTIEHRGSMPPNLRSGVGDWLFGCDICQEVCPWNRRDESQPEAVDAAEMLGLTDIAFRERFGGSALERARRRGLVRNAAIVLGNTGDERALPALRRATTDDDEIVREAATWAIEQIEKRHSPG